VTFILAARVTGEVTIALAWSGSAGEPITEAQAEADYVRYRRTRLSPA
jgi:hypothetical protein